MGFSPAERSRDCSVFLRPAHHTGQDVGWFDAVMHGVHKLAQARESCQTHIVAFKLPTTMRSERTGDAGEGNLLRDLFEGTSVMGALDHAKIEGANEPGARAVEAEAARVARRAAEALRHSRLAVQARCARPW